MFLKKKEPKPKKVKKEKPPKAPKVKRPHKRVSILEIASLISLFAIVGAVGYLVYKNHIKKEVPETDKELVNQLNASFEKHHKAGKKVDLTEVIDGIESDGIIFDRLTFSDSNSELIFDSNENTFGVYENGKGVTYPKEIVRSSNKIDPTLWKFAKKNPGDKENPFSYYLLNGCEGKITVVGGCDVGKNQDIERVAYINVIEKKQEVTIRTNSYETELMVTEDVGDNIAHYGRLGKLTVNRLHTDSYHEYGDCKYAQVTSGRVVAEKGGNIDVAYVLSPVAFLQEKDSGTIGKAYASTYRVRNNSEKADEKYGKKKQLIYDDNLGQQENEDIAIAAGEAAQYTAVVSERIERGLENHPNAIGYAREDSAITIFDSYKEAIEHFADRSIDNPGVVIVTGDGSFSETLNISNTSIIFRGNEDVMPQIAGNFEISHTTGNNQIVFENISFTNNYSSRSNILDTSDKGESTKQNSLQFKNCNFSYNGADSSKATIALAATNGVISTQLSVTNCEFTYGAKSQIGISTYGVVGDDSLISRGSQIVSDQIHIIKNNKFTCSGTSSNPAIVSNYAEINGNTFEGYDTVLSLIPTVIGKTDCQFNVSVSGNTFTKARYLFSLVDADDCLDYMDPPNQSFVFTFDGSNSYSKVTHVANFEVSTTNRYVEKTIESWKSRSWYGVSDPSIGVTLDSIVMDLQTEPYFDFFTLPNGERIKSYTQVETDGVTPRTGYTVKALDENDVEATYYFYATFNKEVNVLFKEGTNEAYVTLLSNGDVESLKVKELTSPVDWLDEDIFEDEDIYKELKYFDVTSEDKVGAIYKLEDAFTTINGNTYVNSVTNGTGDFIEVAKIPVPEPDPLLDPPEPPLEAAPVDLFVSDIGSKSKLILTNDEPLTSPSDEEYVIVLPNDSSVVLSGNFDVEIKGTLKSVKLLNEMRVSVNEGSSISELLEISGEKASGLKLTNRGFISKLIVNSKAEVTNYNIVDKLVAGDITNVKEKNIESMLNNAIDATIYNKDKIYDLTTYSKTRIFNKSGGHIENLTVTYIEGYEKLCAGSLIINDSTMCNVDGNILLFIECTFMNESTGRIGIPSRTEVGGLIIIGDHGNSDAHNKVVFINDGNIRAGRLDETTLATFVVYGVNQDVSNTSAKVRIESNGIITGTTKDEEIVLVINCDTAPSVDKDIKL